MLEECCACCGVEARRPSCRMNPRRTSASTLPRQRQMEQQSAGPILRWKHPKAASHTLLLRTLTQDRHVDRRLPRTIPLQHPPQMIAGTSFNQGPTRGYGLARAPHHMQLITNRTKAGTVRKDGVAFWSSLSHGMRRPLLMAVDSLELVIEPRWILPRSETFIASMKFNMHVNVLCLGADTSLHLINTPLVLSVAFSPPASWPFSPSP
jgi:hypothetical protein